MQIPDSQIIEWNEITPTYLVPGDTFEEWRLKTNGLKVFIDNTKVDKNGDTMDGSLIITNNTGENNFVQFPDGTQQFTAAQRQLLPKAWVNFNATLNTSGTALAVNGNALIRSAHNVSSVTKLTTAGTYQINFIVPMKNTRYCVTGSANASYNSSIPNSSAKAVGVPAPYSLELNNVKITINDPDKGGDEALDPSLVNLMVYATDEPDVTYTGNTTFQFTLVEDSYPDRYDKHPTRYSVGQSWSLVGRITSSTVPPAGNFIFKVKDGRNWQSGSMNTINADVQLLSGYNYRQYEQNVQRAFMDFLVLEVYNLDGILLKTWDIQKRFTINTVDFENVTTTSNPVVTDINPESAYPNMTAFSNTSSTSGSGANVLAQAVFSFTVNA